MVRVTPVRGISLSVLLTFGLWCAAAAAAADAQAGKQAYAVCGSCHGAQGEGNQAQNGPRLAGQAPWYLRQQMQAFQKGMRGTQAGDTHGKIMQPMANMVQDPAALENLIAYIQTFPDTPAPATIDGDVVAGEQTYAVCKACHGDQAQGMEQMSGPALAGQSDWYLVRQIRNYQQGLRGYHPEDHTGRQMKSMVSNLSEEDINNVVAYINTLR